MVYQHDQHVKISLKVVSAFLYLIIFFNKEPLYLFSNAKFLTLLNVCNKLNIMSEVNSLSVVANLLRPVGMDVSKGKGKLCLSTVYLNKINKAFDENVPEDLTSSFHLSDAKASFQIDLQFLWDLVKGTVALKIIPDLTEDIENDVVNLKRFENVKALEIHKVDVRNIIGIQKLRSRIEELTSMYNLENLEDILDKCGGDFSLKYNWSELKRVNFSHNHIQDIRMSFESTPWLQMLDLSHNHIKNVHCIDHLPNLKRLNLSYNKLEQIPKFKGQICTRLQVLLLNNNFIEDISGLSPLTNVQQLDLSQNCLISHNTLLAVSQMPSLYSLDLRGNPMNFHPIHRTLTCNYLNKNITTLNFVLDNVPLTKTEKLLAGSLYPLSQSSLGTNGSYSSQTSLENSAQDRQKKVRNVTIQEGYEINIVQEKKKADCVIPSPRSTDRSHLDVKNKIEQLVQVYGEDWLSKSGGMFQEILNFPTEKPSLLSSTPNAGYSTTSPSNLDKDIASVRSGNIESSNSYVTTPDVVVETDTANETYKTGKPEVESESESDDSSIYGRTPEVEQRREEPISDDEDLEEGESFFGGIAPASIDLCIVVTDTHLSERDSATMKEKARWHINVVKTCQRGDQPNEVKIEFDTGRSDRMSRVYFLEESDKFVGMVFDLMVRHKVPETRVRYQCMKCDQVFSRTMKSSSVVEDEKLTCFKCGSNHIIECK